MTPRQVVGGILIYPWPSVRPFVRQFVRIQIHCLFDYLLQFWSYSFNSLQDIYTHNGDVHVHMILFTSNILKMTGSWTQSSCSSVRIQIHGLSGYLLLQFWSYSFNISYDVYTHNGGVHVHRILIFIKYLIMTGSWTSSPSYCQAGASFVSYRHTSFFKKTHS